MVKTGVDATITQQPNKVKCTIFKRFFDVVEPITLINFSGGKSLVHELSAIYTEKMQHLVRSETERLIVIFDMYTKEIT